MINSTSSSDRTPRADSVELNRPKVVIRNPESSTDQFSAENSTALRVALNNQPEIRPEVVARGRALAADPAYPSAAILGRVAQALIKSPDLSEDQS
jgi:hypothetical protein